MKDTCEIVEFYDIFMKNYIYWGSPEKTMLLVIETAKLALVGIVLVFIPLNYILIIILWVRVLERSLFFFCLFNVIKELNRKVAEKIFGEKFRNSFDPPLEALFEELRKENNGFGKLTVFNS